MRGLNTDELECLGYAMRTCSGKCADNLPASIAKFRSPKDHFDLLEKRGLVIQRQPCPAGRYTIHPVATTLAKLAIECHNLANSTLDPTKI